MMQYRLKGCGRCRGDLYLDGIHGGKEEWACLQCSRRYVCVSLPGEGPARRGAQLALFDCSVSVVMAVGAVADCKRQYHRKTR